MGKRDRDVEAIQIQRILNQRVQNYMEEPVSKIKSELGYQGKEESKASFAVLTRLMMKTKTNSMEIPDVSDSKIQYPVLLKSVRITGNGVPAESMSFQQLDFDDWCNASSWHETKTYQFFNSTLLAFCVYQQYPAGKRVNDADVLFQRIKVVKIPPYDLEHGLKEVWEETKKLILENELVINSKVQKNGKTRRANNLPGIRFNGVAHLRAGGSDGNDTIMLPSGLQIAKQRFWLNAEYVGKLLSEEIE